MPHISLPAHLLLRGNTRHPERLCPLRLVLLGDFILNSDPFYSLLPTGVLSTGSTRWLQQRSGLDAATSSGRAAGKQTHYLPPPSRLPFSDVV